MILRLLVWTALFGGAFVWDYHHQRRSDTPPAARTIRRWRMLGWAAVGLPVIWLSLAPAGFTRRVEVQTAEPPLPMRYMRRPWVIASPPPEAVIFPMALIGGSLLVIGCTLLLHAGRRPG